MTRPSSRPSFAGSTLRIFDLSLAHMLWSKRSVFLAIVAGGPVALAIAVRLALTFTRATLPVVNGERMTGSAIFGLMVWLLFLRFIVPVLGVFYGTSLVADEVEDKTLTYLFTRPIPRGSVLVGKYLSYLVCTVLLVLPSAVITYLTLASMGGAIGEGFPSLLSDLGMLVLGLAAYGAVFGYVGARLKRPLVVGLVFAFGWEQLALIFPGYFKYATVAFFLQALVPHAMPADESVVGGILQLFNEIPPVATSVWALAGITVVALALATRSVQAREFVLDQWYMTRP